jgi:hypothetical protein
MDDSMTVTAAAAAEIFSLAAAAVPHLPRPAASAVNSAKISAIRR